MHLVGYLHEENFFSCSQQITLPHVQLVRTFFISHHIINSQECEFRAALMLRPSCTLRIKITTGSHKSQEPGLHGN